MALQGDPRKDSPLDMCKTCCPTITWKSFTAIITLVDVIMYIVTLAVGGVSGYCDGIDFLPPSPDTLHQFGNRDPWNIRYEAAVWRFITPVFLHANFLHIFFNMAAQLMLGSTAEAMLGTARFVLVYFLCDIGGNLFGALVTSDAAVGASTAIVGILGLFISFVVLNWKRLDPNMKCFIICFIVFIILMNLMFSFGGFGTTAPSGNSSSYQTDNYGHLGGLLTGAFSGMFILSPIGGPPEQYEKNVKYVGYGLTLLYFVLGFSLFFTVVDPIRIFYCYNVNL